MKQNYQKHKKTGTVLENKKEGRSWKEKKGDGPEGRKEGTVLEKNF